MVRQNTAKQWGGVDPPPQFVKSLSDADKARLSSWTDFLQHKGIALEEANGSHFDLWIGQLRLAGVSPGAIDDHRAVVRNLYGFLRHRGVPISLDIWNATNASPTAGSSSSTSTKAASPSATPRLQLVGGKSTTPARGHKTTQAVVPRPVALRRSSAPRFAVPTRDSKLPASYSKKLDRFLATIDTPSTRNNYHTVLEQWLLFLARKGIPVERTGARARNSWKAELRRRNKNEGTRERYIKYVVSFDNWRLYGTTIATKKRRPQTAEVAAPQNDQELLEQFFGAIPNLNTSQGYRTALGQWSEFLAERGETIEHPGPESLESWKAELLSRGKKSKTVYHYTKYVSDFYDWCRKNSSIVAVVPSVIAERRLASSLPISGTPDARDAALQAAFISSLTSPSQAKHYRSALLNWSRFLDDRHVGTLTVGKRQHLIDAWATDMRGRGFTSNTVTRYITAVTAFYSWSEEVVVTPAVQPGPVPRGSLPPEPVLPELAPPEPAASSPGTNGKVEASSVVTAEPHAPLISPEALESLIAKVGVLATASSAHERRLDALNTKLAALPAAPAQEPASKRELEELTSRQSKLELRWETVNTALAALADRVTQLRTLTNGEQVSRAEQAAWAKEMGEMAKQVKAMLYQRADAATKEILASQPQAGSSCVEEIELLINGCFKGLETSNADIIEGAAKLDKAPQGRAWADKLHKALLALDSYAQSKFDGDFKSFCEAMPPGHNIVPTTWVARHEPAATANAERSREERTFPVPSSMAQSGRLFMPEHVILGNGGIGPRLHYYDDRRGQTHKVQIGYIGPHLLSRDTA